VVLITGVPFMNQQLRPTNAFVMASWAVLIAGAGSYLIGLWNSGLMRNEKGYYLTLILFGLFAAISLQKTVRDRIEGIPVTDMYYGICWIACGSAIVLLGIGLFNADLLLSEKGFFAMSFLVAIFAAVTVQKNVRDLVALGPLPGEASVEE
jgi:uncharacterized membrane protein YiaA